MVARGCGCSGLEDIERRGALTARHVRVLLRPCPCPSVSVRARMFSCVRTHTMTRTYAHTASGPWVVALMCAHCAQLVHLHELSFHSELNDAHTPTDRQTTQQSQVHNGPARSRTAKPGDTQRGRLTPRNPR